MWIMIPIDYICGVSIFFALSGFLVWRSIENSVSFEEYSLKRFLRIYPELWVAVCVEVVTMLVLYVPSRNYKTIVFALTQGTILQFWTPENLRGFGCGTANGSLWTVGVMIQTYVALFFIHKALHKKSWKAWPIFLMISFMIPIGIQLIQPICPIIIYKLLWQTFLPYLWLFLIGCFFFFFFEIIIPYLKKYWIVLLMISAAAMISGIDINRESYAMIRCASLAVGLIGFSYAFTGLKIKTDISYAIFLYHMIVVNVMIHFGLTERLMYLIIAVAISLVLACVSTITVGHFSNHLKNYYINANKIKKSIQ